MTLRVGLTGGIGSGKTTVAQIFSTLGIPVYQADEAARRLMEVDATVKGALVKKFGNEVYAGGVLDRKWLSARVFGNDENLAALNSIVHPATIHDAEEWMRNQRGDYAIKEAAIIFESGSHRDLDFVIGVYASPVVRLQRAMKRTGLSAEDVQARMDRQLDDQVKMKLCDWVIRNDEQHALIPQVMDIHEQLSAIASEKKAGH